MDTVTEFCSLHPIGCALRWVGCPCRSAIWLWSAACAWGTVDARISRVLLRGLRGASWLPVTSHQISGSDTESVARTPALYQSPRCKVKWKRSDRQRQRSRLWPGGLNPPEIFVLARSRAELWPDLSKVPVWKCLELQPVELLVSQRERCPVSQQYREDAHARLHERAVACTSLRRQASIAGISSWQACCHFPGLCRKLAQPGARRALTLTTAREEIWSSPMNYWFSARLLLCFIWDVCNRPLPGTQKKLLALSQCCLISSTFSLSRSRTHVVFHVDACLPHTLIGRLDMQS